MVFKKLKINKKSGKPEINKGVIGRLEATVILCLS